MGRAIVKIDPPQFDISDIRRMKDVEIEYHKKEDTLFIFSKQPQAATSFDLDGEMWVRVDMATNSVVGIEIEDFEAVFLKKHPELEIAWRDVKPLCRQKKAITESAGGSDFDSFVRIILNFLFSFLRDHPQQASLPV